MDPPDPLEDNGDPEEEFEEDVPPAPAAFPEEWDIANAVMEAVSRPEASKAMASAAHYQDKGPIESAEHAVERADDRAKVESAPVVMEALSVLPDSRSVRETSPRLPPYILSPIPPSDGENVNMITVVLRPSGDKIRDNVRIRQIYGTLITYPGRDRFAFQVFERGRGYLIEFPNFTTGLCPELIGRLKSFLPDENLRIEPITFQ
jgi:DNA polymerase-3 subunit alpha